jgi:hypothetical protein
MSRQHFNIMFIVRNNKAIVQQECVIVESPIIQKQFVSCFDILLCFKRNGTIAHIADVAVGFGAVIAHVDDR